MLFSWGLDFQWTRSCSEVRNHSWGRMVGNSPPEVSLPPPGNLMCSAFFFSIPAVLWQTLPLPWKLLAGVGVEAAVALAESFRDWNFPGCGGKHARFKKKKKIPAAHHCQVSMLERGNEKSHYTSRTNKLFHEGQKSGERAFDSSRGVLMWLPLLIELWLMELKAII